MATTTNGTAAANGLMPKLTFYTNHGCPWAQRAQITLKELNLPYEEVLIDLSRPREEWYLKINPRGLVPSIRYEGPTSSAIITESAIVSNFLADAFPSHLLPASNYSPDAPLFRARVSFFVDTFFTKVFPKLFATLSAKDEVERESKTKEVVDAIKKEIEPLLENASPFLEGHNKMTMAEVLTAPFLLRLHAYNKVGLLHESVNAQLDELPNYSKWMRATTGQESVQYLWDEKNTLEQTKARMDKMKADFTKQKV